MQLFYFGWELTGNSDFECMVLVIHWKRQYNRYDKLTVVYRIILYWEDKWLNFIIHIIFQIFGIMYGWIVSFNSLDFHFWVVFDLYAACMLLYSFALAKHLCTSCTFSWLHILYRNVESLSRKFFSLFFDRWFAYSSLFSFYTTQREDMKHMEAHEAVNDIKHIKIRRSNGNFMGELKNKLRNKILCAHLKNAQSVQKLCDGSIVSKIHVNGLVRFQLLFYLSSETVQYLF